MNTSQPAAPQNTPDDIDEILQAVFHHGYEFAKEFPNEDIYKVTDTCIAEHAAQLMSLIDKACTEARIQEQVTDLELKDD